MPAGDYFGWAVCGKYITREMAKLAHVKYVQGPFKAVGEATTDLVTKYWLDTISTNKVTEDDAIVFQTMNPDFSVAMPELQGRYNIGYTFFETSTLDNTQIRNAGKLDLVIAGSAWCGKILDRCNIRNKVVIQGVDQRLFNSNLSDKQILKDKFVIYSGGKFEQRKGQDIVIRAFKKMHDKYDNVILMANWFNIFDDSVSEELFNENFKRFSLDPKRIILLRPDAHNAMPYYFQNTDVGLFPSRVEGGTNLVMMEYMACGKPVVATNLTGHMDVLTDNNSFMMNKADPEEAFTLLEYVYKNREEATQVAMYGSEEMTFDCTWERTAKQFLYYFDRLVG